MRIVVVGASVSGACAALLLARAGHGVIVLDRDDLTPAADPEDAARSAFRPGAPQVVQPHGMLPLARNLLVQRWPDVHAALLDAGAIEVPFDWQLPPAIADRTPRPGDDELRMFPMRRTTLDWVLQRALRAEPGVRVDDRTKVTGLLARAGTPPRIVGVRTSTGDLEADLVVDASGRRTHLDRWLTGVGSRPTEVLRAECGLTYHSRHYRIRPGVQLPSRPTTRSVLSLPEFSAGIWGLDRGAVILAVAPLVEDRRFARLTEPDVHEAVLRLVGPLAPWLDVLEPVSGVYPMGGLDNTFRRLVVDETPVATGILAVGDSVCTTNPTLGRGIALALTTAAELADLVARGLAPYAATLAYDAAMRERVEPYFLDQAANDALRLAAVRRAIAGLPPQPPVCEPDRITFDELRRAAVCDAELFRVFARTLGMLRFAADVYRDPVVVTRTRELLAAAPAAAPALGPDTVALTAALGLTRETLGTP